VRRTPDLAAAAPLPAAAKLVLAWEVAASYARARRAVRDSALPDALAALRAVERTRAEPGSATVEGGRRLGRAVARTLALVPGDTRCLMQSLVLTRMLAIRGVESRLVIGVRPGESFAAHAWVERDGQPLLQPGAPSFEELVTL
jgi:hypothetical protein